jgi:hypothetical protein
MWDRNILANRGSCPSVDQGVLFQPDQRAFGDGGGGDQAVLGVGQAAFAEKIPGAEDAEHGLFTVV